MRAHHGKLDKDTALYRSYRVLVPELNITGADLAERTGYSKNAVSAWNTRKSPVPKVIVAYLELLAAVRRVGK